jgi:cytochrome c oxidase subunit 2
VRIEVNAHQWAWDARYSGPDGKFNTADDIVTLNDIRVPIDTPVLFQLASTDVIHSFSLPNFRNKIDAMPGMINRMWIWPVETGEFDIGCTQHCGINHYKMKGRLTVLSKAEFDDWSHAMSEQHARGFDAEDTAAQWGWEWKRHDHDAERSN